MTGVLPPAVLAACLPFSGSSARAQNSAFVPSASSRAAAATAKTTAPASSDREQDGLIGPVRRVRVEMAKLVQSGGSTVESPKVLLEVAAYDPKGNKIDNAYYPVAGNTLTGKEVYQYDDKGNITEMILYDGDNSVLSKEVYAYEFDTLGNWTKMTASLAVIEAGKIVFEPSEVTYRAITYYLAGLTTKLVQPTASGSASTQFSPAKAPKSGGPAIENRVKLPLLEASASKIDAYAAPAFGGESAPGRGSSGGDAKNVIEISEQPPEHPLRRGPFRPISRGVLNGTAASLPKPIYPDVAKRARVAGLVTVEVIVDETGKVVSARAVSGPTMLHQAAMSAATQARFSPTLLSGQPVKVSGVITYNFIVSR